MLGGQSDLGKTVAMVWVFRYKGLVASGIEMFDSVYFLSRKCQNSIFSNSSDLYCWMDLFLLRVPAHKVQGKAEGGRMWVLSRRWGSPPRAQLVFILLSVSCFHLGRAHRADRPNLGQQNPLFFGSSTQGQCFQRKKPRVSSEGKK